MTQPALLAGARHTRWLRLGSAIGTADTLSGYWSLTALREKLIKIGAKGTRHSKYVFFQLAEVTVTRNLFAAILDRIERLARPPPLVAGHGA